MGSRAGVKGNAGRGFNAAADAKHAGVAAHEPKVYIGGKLFEKADAKISVFDHGLLYGDGVFEGIRSYCGKVFRLEQHVDRLYDSAQAIHLQSP